MCNALHKWRCECQKVIRFLYLIRLQSTWTSITAHGLKDVLARWSDWDATAGFYLRHMWRTLPPPRGAFKCLLNDIKRQIILSCKSSWYTKTRGARGRIVQNKNRTMAFAIPLIYKYLKFNQNEIAIPENNIQHSCREPIDDCIHMYVFI